MRFFTFCMLFSLSGLFVSGQQVKIDSLKTILSNPPTAYAEVNALNSMSREVYLLGLVDSAAYFAKRAMERSNELGYKRGLAAACLNHGNAFMNRGLFDTARYFFDEALLNYRLVGDFKGVGAAYNSFGNILLSQGDYDAA